MAEIIVRRCWGGCGRVLLPRAWTPEWLPILHSERRVGYGEYLCRHDDCPANAIAERGR